MSTLLLWLALAPAHAAGWADYAPAFPVFPCPDGWMSCIVAGESVGPELGRDGAGMPAPSDLRVGWFDLQPRATFSPFATLSPYEPAPAPTPAAPPAEVAKVAVETPVQELPTEPAVEPPKGEEKVAQLRPREEQKADPAPKVEPTPVVHEEKKAPEPPKDDAALCGNLVSLEPKAMLGKLSADELGCLDRSYAAAAKITDKDKISRTRMADAYSRGDMVTWERLAKRHLDEIDQSDPDIAYKYALQLSKDLPARANGVIRWTEVALERRTVWSGETYTQRVGKLYALRTKAAQSLWQAAEEEHAKAPTDTTKKKIEETRAQTKVFAREWVEYQLAAGKDATVALQVCTSAAGTSEYCQGR
jgi:hypothetical protein